MAGGINLNANFELQNNQYLDARQIFTTLAEMKAFNTARVPEGFITFCDEDKINYQYLSINSDDPTTGKWRPFTTAANIINDALTDSLASTWSITKIKQVMSSMHGFLPVASLPDLTDPRVQATIEENKIYLVPLSKPDSPNKNDYAEYVCVHVPTSPAVMRTAFVTVEQDWNDWKAEIEGHVSGGGTTADSYEDYKSATSTTMNASQYADMTESVDNNDTDFNAYTARVTAIELRPAVNTETWNWELLGSIGNATLVFDDFAPNKDFGKLKKNVSLLNRDPISVLKDMLTEPTPTTITLTGSEDATKLYELGVATIPTVDLTATIALGTGEVAVGADIIFKRDGAEINKQQYQDGVFVYNFTDSTPINSTTKYTVEVAYTMDSAPATATGPLQYNFAYPMFYGASGTKTVADPTALTKVLSAAKEQKLTYNTSNEYCVFAIPATMAVKKILDQNLFDNTGAFDVVTQSVQIGSTPVDYKVYTTGTPNFSTNFLYTFTLA